QRRVAFLPVLGFIAPVQRCFKSSEITRKIFRLERWNSEITINHYSAYCAGATLRRAKRVVRWHWVRWVRQHSVFSAMQKGCLPSSVVCPQPRQRAPLSKRPRTVGCCRDRLVPLIKSKPAHGSSLRLSAQSESSWAHNWATTSIGFGKQS